MKSKASIFAILVASAAVPLSANPEGGQVAAGSANIAGQGSATVTVNQASNTAIINWQSFSIGSGETTKFIQPSSTSAALNRVLGGQTSIIDGTLSANGRIFLLNGNGILVGQNGVITTAAFTGSTRNISDSDFLSGNLHFVGSSDGGVTNYGKISALGGDVVLIGKTVDNEGSITASNTAALAAGDDVLLAQMNADGSTVTVNPVSSPTPATNKVGVKNSGTIKASAAELKAANGNIYALAIQNDGLVQATTVTEQGGHIFLTSDAGTIINSGTLNASATAAKGHGGSILVKSKAGKVVHTGKIIAKGGQGGVGGQVEVSGKQVALTGTVDTTAPGGVTGDFLLDPDTLEVVSGTGGTFSNGGDTDTSTSSTVGNLTLNEELNTTNVILLASNSITVDVGATIAWTSGNTLTFQTTNSSGSTLTINAPIIGTSDGTTSGTPNGSLVIDLANTTDPATTSLAGMIDVGSFILQSGAWKQVLGDNLPATQTVNNVTTNTSLPGFTASQDFEIQNGSTFLRAAGGNGSSDSPYVITDIYGLQGVGGFLSSNFTGQYQYPTYATIDAGVTANWNGGAGFVPIGTYDQPFTGSLKNLYVNNLTVNQTLTENEDDAGLIGVVGPGGNVNYVILNAANITGTFDVGAIAGENYGTIESCYVYNSTITGTSDVGGIVGYNGDYYYGGETEQVRSNDVVADGGSDGVYSPGEVEFSTVQNVNVTGESWVGGIAGETAGDLYFDNVQSTSEGASATTINGTTLTGGIVGVVDSDGTVEESGFYGTVQGQDGDSQSQEIGGIAGENDGTITGSNTFLGAIITGDTAVGGIAGVNAGTISDSYNAGSVTGNNTEAYGPAYYIGGIAGYNGAASDLFEEVGSDFSEVQTSNSHVFSQAFDDGPSFTYTIQTSYNSGSVSGGEYVGGIVGLNGNFTSESSGVTTCYNVGPVSGDFYVGGLVGGNYGTVEYGYNSGAVSGDPGTTGGIIGYDNDFATMHDVYLDTTTSGQSVFSNSSNGDDDENAANEYDLATVNPGDGSAYTIQNQDSESGTGYAFLGNATYVSGTNGVYAIGTSPDSGGGAAWYIIEGQTRPMLAMEHEQGQQTGIQSPHELQLMAVDLTASYYIGDNLPYGTLYLSRTDTANTNGADNDGSDNTAEVWTSAGFDPIGQLGEAYAFSGQFNGSYMTLYQLYINRPDMNGVGLFGATTGSSDSGSGASVREVYLWDPSITGGDYTGGIVGYSQGNISYSTVYSDGSGGISGGSQVGGLAGYNSGSITYSYDSQYNSDGAFVTGSGDSIGGIAGYNDTDGLIEYNQNTAGVASSLDGFGTTGVGGIVGTNYGRVSQSVNLGNVGSGEELRVGGIVGDNNGQVDDSYSGGGSDSGTISGASFVGGLVGWNEEGATLETSYNTSTVSGGDSSAIGGVSGENDGTAQHVYYDNETTNQSVAIGVNNDVEDTTDVPDAGYTTAQLTDMRNFTQGASPGEWDFTPQTGIWGIDVYTSYGEGPVNGGLPVLQWQTSVTDEAVATNGQQYYGYQPGYTVTGFDAANASHFLNPNISVTGDGNAGGTQQIVLSGNPTTYNGNYYSVEYVPGTTNIVPDPITIVANSYNISSGSPAPSYTVTYNGFQPNGSPEDLNGELTFTVSPDTLADGLHTITPSGLSSSNYAITYVNGVLNIGTPSPGQTLLTFETELQNIQTAFANDPTNGLDPVYFLIFPNIPGLGGDEVGAINDPADGYLAYASGTSHLPAFDRLVTPGVGVVEIIDGVVIVGNPATGNPIYISNPNGGLPIDVTKALQGVVSADVYKQLLPYASH